MRINGIKIYIDKEINVVKEGLYKVIIVDTQIRFALLGDVRYHSDMADVFERHNVCGGGTIAIWENDWDVVDNYSATLNVSLNDTHIKKISETLGKPFHSDLT